MLFSDEMSVLADRFREVTVTLPSPSLLPPGLPKKWLAAESADCVVRFVESEYQEADTPQIIASVFPEMRDLTIESDAVASDLPRDREVQTRQQEPRGMRQILYIFRKDSRGFWPEILIALVATTAFFALYRNAWGRTGWTADALPRQPHSVHAIPGCRTHPCGAQAPRHAAPGARPLAGQQVITCCRCLCRRRGPLGRIHRDIAR